MSAKKRSELWERLRAARIARDKTQEDVGNYVGVSKNAVTQWEHVNPVKRTRPNNENLQAVCTFLDVPLVWMLSDESDPKDATFGRVAARAAAAASVNWPKEDADARMRAERFWALVKQQVLFEHPEYAESFDAELDPHGLQLRVPLLHEDRLFSFAHDSRAIEPASAMLSREIAHVLLIERAAGRALDKHLMVWSDNPNGYFKPYVNGCREQYGVEVCVCRSVQEAVAHLTATRH